MGSGECGHPLRHSRTPPSLIVVFVKYKPYRLIIVSGRALSGFKNMDFSMSWSPLDTLLSYFIVAVVVAGALLLVSKENPETSAHFKMLTNESTSMYECGFEPFHEPSELYFVPYFSVAVLFLLFDLELVYLLPLVLNSNVELGRSLCIVLSFVGFIAFGLWLEWRAESFNLFKAQQLAV